MDGLRLKMKKICFHAITGSFFGIEINKKEIFLVSKKTDSITNVSELISFLVLLNYYYTHFRNFAVTSEHLYKLLRIGINPLTTNVPFI